MPHVSNMYLIAEGLPSLWLASFRYGAYKRLVAILALVLYPSLQDLLKNISSESTQLCTFYK